MLKTRSLTKWTALAVGLVAVGCGSSAWQSAPAVNVGATAYELKDGSHLELIPVNGKTHDALELQLARFAQYHGVPVLSDAGGQMAISPGGSIAGFATSEPTLWLMGNFKAGKVVSLDSFPEGRFAALSSAKSGATPKSASASIMIGRGFSFALPDGWFRMDETLGARPGLDLGILVHQPTHQSCFVSYCPVVGLENQLKYKHLERGAGDALTLKGKPAGYLVKWKEGFILFDAKGQSPEFMVALVGLAGTWTGS